MAINAPTVLLLEDEPLISMDVELLLEEEGFQVTAVMSCLEASKWLERHQPDIVVVDIELRDGPCTDVVNHLLETDIPFVVHTGGHPSRHVDTPFGQGIWVSKPAAPEELIQAIRDALIAQRAKGLASYA